jgi:NTP pyrophosphatase (non-canonical NTP hydrolase)
VDLDEFATLLNDLEEAHYPIKYPEHGRDAIRLLSIVEELGEIARIINKRAIGRREDETTDAHLEEEFGDLLLNLLAAVKSYGVSPLAAIKKAALKWGKIVGTEVPVPDAGR